MPGNEITGIVTTKRTWPFLAAGVFCLIWSSGLPALHSALLTTFLIYHPWIYLLSMAVFATIVFSCTEKIEVKNAKGTFVPVQNPEAKSLDGLDQETKALMDERDKTVQEIKTLNQRIPGVKISTQIAQLETLTNQIISYVIEHPEKLPQIRRFMDYYLPTTLKLLNAYARMEDSGMDGENVGATKVKIEEIMDTIVSAFSKQMNALFADEAMDLVTDITVMENMLKQEGLDTDREDTIPLSI